MAKPLIALGLALGLALDWAAPAAAESLPDPTRPPAELAQTADAEAAPAGPTVTSLMLHERKAYAIVGGRVVRVGDEVGAARVSRIDEGGVWLKGPAGVERLELLPGVRKTPSKKPRQERR